MDRSIHFADFIVFGLGIFVSLAAGIYLSFKERKHMTQFHFHRGGGNLKALPVAMSLLVTFESSIFFLGYPAEVYVHGFIFWLVNIAFAIGYSSIFWLGIPLFYPLQVTSVFEYFQMRHESLVIRRVVMVLSVIHMTLYAGIVIFGAAIALESVTGIDSWIMTVAMSAVAVFYTSLGGLRAVVATDVVQRVVMLGIIAAVLINGTIQVGGVSRVIELNRPSGRMKLIDFDPNPLTRHTFWTLMIGYIGRSVGFSCRQPVVQRLNSMKSRSEAKKVAMIAIPCFVILQLFVMIEGLVAYAYFADKRCDPLASGAISNANQIISYTVMDMFSHVPGMTGLFLAGLCSASLSTISSLLSSVSAIISEDFIRPKYRNMSEKTLTKASKVIVLTFGVVCILVSLAISNIKGPMTQITGSLLGSLDGPVNAVFFLSIFISFSTRKGIYASTIIGFFFGLWLSLGYNFSKGRKKTPWLPLGPTDRCFDRNYSTAFNNSYSVDTNSTLVNVYSSLSPLTTEYYTPYPTASDDEIHGLDYMYSISYAYIALMVTVVAVVAGLVVSAFTSDRPDRIPEHLLIRLDKRFFRCQPRLLQTLENEGEDVSLKHATDSSGHDN